MQVDLFSMRQGSARSGGAGRPPRRQQRVKYKNKYGRRNVSVDGAAEKHSSIEMERRIITLAAEASGKRIVKCVGNDLRFRLCNR